MAATAALRVSRAKQPSPPRVDRLDGSAPGERLRQLGDLLVAEAQEPSFALDVVRRLARASVLAMSTESARLCQRCPFETHPRLVEDEDVGGISRVVELVLRV